MESLHREWTADQSMQQAIAEITPAQVISMAEMKAAPSEGPANRLEVNGKGGLDHWIEAQGEIAVADNKFELAALIDKSVQD